MADSDSDKYYSMELLGRMRQNFGWIGNTTPLTCHTSRYNIARRCSQQNKFEDKADFQFTSATHYSPDGPAKGVCRELFGKRDREISVRPVLFFFVMGWELYSVPYTPIKLENTDGLQRAVGL